MHLMVRYAKYFLIIIMLLAWNAAGFAASTEHTSHHKTQKNKHHAHKKTHKNHHSHKHRLPQVYDDAADDDEDDDTASNTSPNHPSSLNSVLTANLKKISASENISPINTTSSSQGFSAVSHELVGFIHKTVNTFHYSAYRLGGKLFDMQKGIYVLDCSGFVDKILQKTCPRAYSSLVDATGADAPASQHYYHFFNELAYDSDSYWNKVENVDQLRPGDILVIRYKNSRGIQTGGHVMVVMNQPEKDTDVFYVRVADSAPTRHSDDTREYNTSGIGIGTLLLKANTRTGQPIAYAWGIGGYWNKNASFAMARPVAVG